MKRVKVKCLECGESDLLVINDQTHQVIDYEKKMITPFRSFRWRGDLTWGFLCKCGNDSRLAKNEAKDFDKLVAGDPISVKKIAEGLKIPDKNKFRMETL